LHFDEGHVKLKIPYRGNENHVGFMYAGSIFTLAESSVLPLCFSAWGMDCMNDFLPVVGKYSIKYLKPVTNDLFVEVKLSKEVIDKTYATYKEKRKAKLIVEKEVKDKDGKVYATTSGVYFLLRNPRPEMNEEKME